MGSKIGVGKSFGVFWEHVGLRNRSWTVPSGGLGAKMRPSGLQELNKTPQRVRIRVSKRPPGAPSWRPRTQNRPSWHQMASKLAILST